MPEQKHWFKARKYGWGWRPVSWQGWTALLSCFAVIGGAAWLLLSGTDPETVPVSRLIIFFAITAASIAALTALSYRHGESPRWRWGDKEHGPKE